MRGKNILKTLVVTTVLALSMTTIHAADTNVSFDGDAEDFIFLDGSQDLFDNFKNIIQRLLSDNILFLKITEKEIFKVSTSHTYCNPDNGAYELSFIYTYTSIADANNISLVTKRIFIALNSNATNFFVVKDILVSDNLTTITKKTSDEYNNIASKDNETMYAITDA